MSRITGTGHAVPENFVSSRDIERRLGLDEGWIEQRTGIVERPVVAPDEATSDLSLRAGRQALEAAGLSADDLGLLLLATSTPDHLLPPTAPLVAERMGVKVGAVDVTGACAGFLYALSMADAFCRVQQRPVLVIGANVLSRRVNPDDAATAALFSDGAGAVVVEPAADEGRGLRGFYLGSDGAGYDGIHIPAGGSRRPMTAEAAAKNEHLIHIARGGNLFRKAVEAMTRAGEKALEASGFAADAVDWWIPHQANARITRKAGESLGIAPARTVSTIARYGNSSAATIPLALSLTIAQGRIEAGQTLLLTAVGAGMIEAGAVVVW